jgi:hypothetical protein
MRSSEEAVLRAQCTKLCEDWVCLPFEEVPQSYMLMPTQRRPHEVGPHAPGRLFKYGLSLFSRFLWRRYHHR